MTVTPGREELLARAFPFAREWGASDTVVPMLAAFAQAEIDRLAAKPADDPDAMNEKRAVEDARLVANVREACAAVCDHWIGSKNLHEHLAATDIKRLILKAPTAGAATLAEIAKPADNGWTFAKLLSNALLKIRPLGGSELFVKRNGDYYADPEYCGRMIEEMRASLHQEIRARIRREKPISTTGEPKP